MIYKLRSKLFKISALVIFTVLFIIFMLIQIINMSQVNHSLDMITDTISAHGGRFPKDLPDNDKGKPPFDKPPNIITPETRDSTRYFVTHIDRFGNCVNISTEHISSINKETAKEYSQEVIEKGKERGWISNFRYKVYNDPQGKAIIFVDGSVNRAMSQNFMFTVGLVLFFSGVVILVLIFILSKPAVKPIAESYEKQKQFITDINHELKTPLTLILANLDIAQAELGENEWLGDIREEANRMTSLVNELVTLTRMDEEQNRLVTSDFDISSALSDIASDFEMLANEQDKSFSYNIEPNLIYTGDETAVRRLVYILLENAVKYCDANGNIEIDLHKKRNIIISVENTYKDVKKLEFNRLFDRFYRADKARTKGGFGIGLSIAKSIAENHHGTINAFKKGDDVICFKAVLK